MSAAEEFTRAEWLLRTVVTEAEDADRVLNVAAARGVDAATCAALRAEWDAMYRRSVTVLGGAA